MDKSLVDVVVNFLIVRYQAKAKSNELTRKSTKCSDSGIIMLIVSSHQVDRIGGNIQLRYKDKYINNSCNTNAKDILQLTFEVSSVLWS